jgi:hypothetical protein
MTHGTSADETIATPPEILLIFSLQADGLIEYPEEHYKGFSESLSDRIINTRIRPKS